MVWNQKNVNRKIFNTYSAKRIYIDQSKCQTISKSSYAFNSLNPKTSSCQRKLMKNTYKNAEIDNDGEKDGYS